MSNPTVSTHLSQGGRLVAPRPPYRIRILSRILLLFLAVAYAGSGRADEPTGDPPPGDENRAPADSGTGQTPSTDIEPADPQWPDDSATWLDRESGRTDADRDRQEALALFAHGRWLTRRGDAAGALGRYQRAWRYDPDNDRALRQTVPLAIQLQRYDLAARYALIAQSRGAVSPVLLRQLGSQQMTRQNWETALKLFEPTVDLKERTTDPLTILVFKAMGRLYYLTGRTDDACTALLPVHDALVHPEKYEFGPLREQLVRPAEVTYSLLAEVFLASGKLDLADETFREAARRFGDNAESDEEKATVEARLALNLARVAVKRRRWSVALANLDEYFRAMGRRADAAASDGSSGIGGELPLTLLREAVEGQESDPAPAKSRLIERLRALRDRFPDDQVLAFQLAKQLQQDGRSAEASRLARSLVDRGSVDELSPREVIEVLVAGWEPRDALDSLVAVAQRARWIADRRDWIEPVLADRALAERLLNECEAALEEAGEADDGALALVGAELALGLEAFDRADRLIDRAVGQAPDDEVALDLLEGYAARLTRADRFASAAGLHRVAIDKCEDPQDAFVFYFYLAGVLELEGNTEGALKAAEKAAELAPDSPLMASRKAWVQFHAGRYDDAAESYRQVLGKFDASHDNQAVREVMRDTRIALSNIAVQQGDTRASEEWLEQVLDEFPEDVGALNDLGYLWIDQNKRLARSVEMVRKAVEAEPDNSAYRDSLGWGYYRQGRYEEAVAELEKAADVEQPDAVILDHLGEAYLKCGDVAKALECWRRAADVIDPSESEKLETLKKKIADSTSGQVGER